MQGSIMNSSRHRMQNTGKKILSIRIVSIFSIYQSIPQVKAMNVPAL